MILENYFFKKNVTRTMKLTFKNIAITLGIAAGAAAAAVITTKSMNKSNALGEKKSEETKEELATPPKDQNKELEEDILYV